MKKLIAPFFLIALFVPYLFRPFALNLDADSMTQLMNIVRMVDARWSFSLDPSAAYANPLVQILVYFHGIYRHVILFPVLYILDAIGMGIREVTIGGVFVGMGIVLTLIMYRLMKSVVGSERAWWWTALFSVIPLYALHVKGGWWHIFVYPLFLAGIAAEHRYLTEKKSQWYAWFCIAVGAYTLADPAFVFGYLWYALYAAVYFLREEGSIYRALCAFWRMLRQWWTLVPALVLVGLAAVTYVGARYFDAQFGMLARFFEKGAYMGFGGFGVIPHFLVQGMGLTGWVLFPLILVSAVWWVVAMARRRSVPPFLQASALFVLLASVLILLAHGAGGAVYVLFVPGVIAVVALVAQYKHRAFAMAGAALLLLLTYGQTLWYITQWSPPAWLMQRYSFIQSGEPCQALWCPSHFAEPRNLGVTTAAFVVRDHLDIQPIPFVSIQENFYVRPKEIFFYTTYQQGPSFSIGRRINYDISDIAAARIILAFTPEVSDRAPGAFEKERNQRVWDFIKNHPEYKEVATVTMEGVEMIKIFERDSTRQPRAFSVEEYDRKFNEKYGNLRDLGHIDLG